MDNDNKNLIAFVALAFVLLFAYTTYSYFFIEPVARQAAAARAKVAAAAQVAQTPVTAQASVKRTPRLCRPERRVCVIATPALSGSIVA